MISTVEERKSARLKALRWYFTIGFSELCGTALLVFVSCLGTLPNFSDPPNPINISLGAGTVVFVILQTLGQVSGSHINPTVTIAAMICRVVTVPAGLLYILAQFVGAILGYGTLLILLPKTSLLARNSTEDNHNFCVTLPHPKLNPTQAFFFEYIADFILVILCWGVWQKRSQSSLDLAPIKIGLTVFGLLISFGNFTGPSLNTARSFAPAIFTGVWTSHWIYWLAPVSAAVVGSFFYKVLFHNFQNLNEPDEH